MTPDKVISHQNYLMPLKSSIDSAVKCIHQLSAINSLKTYGITKSHMRFILQNIRTIEPVYKKALSYYKVLHWDSDYAVSSVTNGIIERDGIQFNVIYIGCTRLDVLQSKSKKATLSFRMAKPEYALPAYVLVKPYKV